MRWPWQRHMTDTQHTQYIPGALTEARFSGPRARVTSRPRVANAAAEAAAAYRSLGGEAGNSAGDQTGGTLGSAVAGPPAYLVRGRPIPNLPTIPASAMGATPTMPALALAAAYAARQAGRTPEEVWAEALQVWLEEYAGVDDEAESAPSQPLATPHRQRAWLEIEETLRLLRAS